MWPGTQVIYFRWQAGAYRMRPYAWCVGNPEGRIPYPPEMDAHMRGVGDAAPYE